MQYGIQQALKEGATCISVAARYYGEELCMKNGFKCLEGEKCVVRVGEEEEKIEYVLMIFQNAEGNEE